MLTHPRLRHLRIRAAILLMVGFPVAWAQAAVTGLDRIEITVHDTQAATRFYQEALGFRMEIPWHPAGDATRRLLGAAAAHVSIAVLRLGDERVELDAFDPPGRPYPAGSHSPDLWFQHFAIVVSDMRSAYARLQPWHLTAITVGGPQALPPSNGRVAAFKFRDPDGHPLELLWFPAGQGCARWRKRRGPLFLGIDHSAIVVADTAASLRFYRDGLGLRQAYATLNRGAVQSHLDDVPDAVVQVTGLRSRSGDSAGIEMLQYQPPDGRSAPPAVAADIWKTRLVLTVDNLEATLAGLPPGLNGAIQTFSDGNRAAMVRDPDGHLVILEQRAVRAR